MYISHTWMLYWNVFSISKLFKNKRVYWAKNISASRLCGVCDFCFCEHFFLFTFSLQFFPLFSFLLSLFLNYFFYCPSKFFSYPHSVLLRLTPIIFSICNFICCPFFLSYFLYSPLHFFCPSCSHYQSCVDISCT